MSDHSQKPSFSPSDLNVLGNPLIFNNPVGNYVWDGKQIEIRGSPLKSHDRKTLIAIEYLYMKKHGGDFSSPYVTFTFAEIAAAIGIAPNNYATLFESIKRLNEITINTLWRVRVDLNVANDELSALPLEERKALVQKAVDAHCEANHIDSKKAKIIDDLGTIEIRGGNHLIDKWDSVMQFSTDSDKPSSKHSVISVKLSDWHVYNFRNRYYRLIDRSLYSKLNSGIAIAMLDYITFNGYYRGRGGYVQRPSITISYDDLVLLSGSTKYDKATIIRKQLKKLHDLVNIGVLSSWDLVKDPYTGGYSIVMKAGSTRIQKLQAVVAKEDHVMDKLLASGLSRSQVLKFQQEHTADYLEEKIANFSFVSSHCPHLFKNHKPVTYLFKSIQDNWIASEYTQHKAEVARKQKLKEEQELIEAQTALHKSEGELKVKVADMVSQFIAGLTDERKAALIAEERGKSSFLASATDDYLLNIAAMAIISKDLEAVNSASCV